MLALQVLHDFLYFHSGICLSNWDLQIVYYYGKSSVFEANKQEKTHLFYSPHLLFDIRQADGTAGRDDRHDAN